MMAYSTKTLTMGLAVVLCVAMAVAPLAEAITCGQVTSALAPCVAYIRAGGGGAVPAPCCSGISSLNNAAKTTPDRQQACTCIKSAAAAVTGINFGLAAGIPGKCGVNIPYKLSPSIDCKR